MWCLMRWWTCRSSQSFYHTTLAQVASHTQAYLHTLPNFLHTHPWLPAWLLEPHTKWAAVASARLWESFEDEADPYVALQKCIDASQDMIERELDKGVELEDTVRELTSTIERNRPRNITIHMPRRRKRATCILCRRAVTVFFA